MCIPVHGLLYHLAEMQGSGVLLLLFCGSTSNSCLVTDASVLCWDECLPLALVTSGAACTLLLWCQTSTWLKLRRRYKAGTCSVLLSLLEMTALQESSSGR